MKIAELEDQSGSSFIRYQRATYVGSLALILPPAPCSAVRNFEWINAALGEGFFMRWALSRTSLKYGSWSMAMGIRHGILAIALVRSSCSWPQISGYDVANAAALRCQERIYCLLARRPTIARLGTLFAQYSSCMTLAEVKRADNRLPTSH